MDQSTKQDIKLSFIVGFFAGLLLLPILNNFHVSLTVVRGGAVVLGMTLFTPTGYLLAYWLSRRWPVMMQFGKFGIVGGLNTLIDLGVLNLLIAMTGIASGVWYPVFKSISFLIGVTNSFFWNKFWTFRSTEKASAGVLVKFFLVNLIAFLMNVGAASIVVNVIGVPAGVSPKLWANLGAVSAVFISSFWNFTGFKYIVFKR